MNIAHLPSKFAAMCVLPGFWGLNACVVVVYDCARKQTNSILGLNVSLPCSCPKLFINKKIVSPSLVYLPTQNTCTSHNNVFGKLGRKLFRRGYYVPRYNTSIKPRLSRRLRNHGLEKYRNKKPQTSRTTFNTV